MCYHFCYHQAAIPIVSTLSSIECTVRESTPPPYGYAWRKASVSPRRGGVSHGCEPSDFWQPRQRLDCSADRLQVVMGVDSIHVSRSVSGELLAQFLGNSRIRERAVE